MFDLIEKLRQKSDKSKNKIAFLTSFTFSGLIFVVWLTIIYPDLKFIEKQKQTATASESSLSGSFIENMKEGFLGLKKEINDLKSVVDNVGTSTYYVSNNSSTVNKNNSNNSMLLEPYSTSTEREAGSY